MAKRCGPFLPRVALSPPGSAPKLCFVGCCQEELQAENEKLKEKLQEKVWTMALATVPWLLDIWKGIFWWLETRSSGEIDDIVYVLDRVGGFSTGGFSSVTYVRYYLYNFLKQISKTHVKSCTCIYVHIIYIYMLERPFCTIWRLY